MTHEINLEMCPWQLLHSEDSKEWLVKFKCQKHSYHIALCDLSSVFIEKMESPDIQKRCKEINRRLEAPTENIVSHINHSYLQHHNLKFKINQEENSKVTVSFSNSFNSGIPFHWNFICSQETVENSGSITKTLLLNPLISTVSRLLCENTKLKEVIKEKDEEISDYRDSGYKVSRPHLKTNPFEVKMFETDLKMSQDYFLSVSEDLMKIMSSNNVNNVLLSTSRDRSSSNSTDLKESVVSNNQSPSKRRVKRKPRPATRGCILNVTDDNDESNSISYVQDESRKSEEPVLRKKPKKQKKKTFF